MFPVSDILSRVTLTVVVKSVKNLAHARSPASVVSPRLSPGTSEHSVLMIGKKIGLSEGRVQVLSACPTVTPLTVLVLELELLAGRGYVGAEF